MADGQASQQVIDIDQKPASIDFIDFCPESTILSGNNAIDKYNLKQ